MKKFFLALAAIAALASCQKKDEMKPYVGDTSRPVSFSVENIYSLETKADPIASGKKVGIYAGEPINKENVAFNVTMTGANAGTLAPVETNSLLWGVGQTTQATKFLGIYPYIPGLDLSGETESDKYIGFTLHNADDMATLDEILTASASQAPGTGETPAKVALTFSHPFAKLVYNIDNQTDDYVAAVKVSGVHPTGKIVFTSGAVVATGDPISSGAPFAIKEVVANSQYMMVVPPEASAVNPAVTVEMVSGAKYNFALTAGVPLAAGKVYTASITLDGSHVVEQSDRTVLGTFTVTDWENVNAGSMTGGVVADAEKWWYLEGNIDEVGGTSDGEWQKHIPFKCIGTTIWEVDFYYATEEVDIDHGLKIRYAADATDWSDSWGVDLLILAEDIPAEGKLVQGLTQSGSNIRIDTPGKYRIHFYTDTHDFHIYKFE
ncbi:MAG: fimbrillin family protein [Bacteroidales bacterium]|nr:fimbrillin family protein [Bacteroidales bacterium]